MQTVQQVAEELTQLKQQIAQHDYAYYVCDAPTISDNEYDGLYRQLIVLETQYPQLYKKHVRG